MPPRYSIIYKLLWIILDDNAKIGRGGLCSLFFGEGNEADFVSDCIALGRMQKGFGRKERFGFVHKQLSEEPPKVGRERKSPILAVAHKAKIGHILLCLRGCGPPHAATLTSHKNYYVRCKIFLREITITPIELIRDP